MANEIQSALYLKATKGGTTETAGSVTTSNITMTGTNMQKRTQVLSTTPEVIDTGDCGSAGLVQIKNLDASIVVSLCATDGANTVFATLKPGESCQFRQGAANLAKSASGTPKIEVMAVEN